jgi:hypothetical protein
MRSLFASAAALVVAGAAAQAGTDLKLAPFSAIEAHGGSHVTIHHGDVQRVSVIKGDLNVSRVSVSGDKLLVEVCPNWCWQSHDLEIEVTTPRAIEALTAHGGSNIDARGPFPRQPQLRVTAHGGGDIDARAIPADAVSAEAHGGGDIHVQALSSLQAEAHGGGDIHFTGKPAKVQTNIHGGGDVGPE